MALLPAGTRGDHQPYLALAHEFRARGHDVEITATRNQAHIVRNADFEPHVIPFDAAELLETTAAKRALASGRTLPFVRIRDWCRSTPRPSPPHRQLGCRSGKPAAA
ncbi:glycosyltransferase [Nocardia asteroides]